MKKKALWLALFLCLLAALPLSLQEAPWAAWGTDEPEAAKAIAEDGQASALVLALEKGPLSMLANLFGKEKEEGGVAKANTSGIQSFSYRYHNSFRAGSYAYEAECEEEAVTLGYKAADYSEFGKMTCQPEQKLLTELDALCREFSVAKWNGFNKSDPNALDGDGFSLDIKYKDGGKISAHGSNAYPKGYGDFRKKLNALMKPYVDAMLAEEIRKSREKGVSGELRGYSVNFLQRGESGRDKYKFFILDSGSREDNVDIEIESVSGDIFPAGKYRYYGHLDDAALRFGEFQAILDKYNIVNWNYYDRVAEDYNNSEWFQVTFYFSSGDSIQAMGTEHPEQYDAFRKEWLELVLAMEPDLKALSH